MLRSLTSFLTLFLLLATINGSAQSVGVVLSGGGAKGLYHIGVLEALEQNGIPIDYVAGTSMGSIVAGLYAAGYSPAQMREIVTSGEIESWLSGRIDSSYGAYYRQYRRTPSLFSLRLDTQSLIPLEEEVTNNLNSSIDGSTSKTSQSKGQGAGSHSNELKTSLYLPSSLISTTQVDLTLSKLFSAASAYINKDFDKLMVPFLCVASDMRNYQAVVLTDGDLGESIRASMAIPIAFNPVERDTMLLFDGGIYDNFPWQPLVERHSPDVIIGSICTAGNTELTMQSSLVEQVFAISTQKSEYVMPEGNITIQRDVPVGMLDFGDGDQIIDMGYADAMVQIEEIKERITERRAEEYYDNRRAEFLEGVKPLIFEDYQINGLTEEQNLYVRDFLHTSSNRRNVLQREMPFEELQENLYQILSSGDFSTKYPTVKYNPHTQRYKFAIDLETKPQLKLSLGGHLSSTAFNQLLLSLNYTEIKRVAQSYYADLYLGTIATSAMMGGRTDFYVKSPLFIDYYYSFSSINMQYTNLGNISDITNSESVKTRDNHISAAVGLPLSRRSLLTFRANAGQTNYYYDPPSTDIYDENLFENLYYDRTRLSYFAGKVEFERSTLDKQIYPQKGSKLEASLITVFSNGRNYETLYGSSVYSTDEPQRWFGARLKYEKYFTPPGESWFSLGVSMDGVYTNIRQFGNPTATMLMMPSYQPVTHSKMIFMPDYSSDRYVAGGIMPTFNILPKMLWRTGLYGMYRNYYQINGVDSSLISSQQMHYIVESSFVYHTSLGAVSLSLTKYDLRDWDNLYLTFGFGIPIFAPKGTFY